MFGGWGVVVRYATLGNMVVAPDRQWGLCVVADMRFLRGPLSRRMIQRNIQHFGRYLSREKLDGSFPLAELEQALLTP